MGQAKNRGTKEQRVALAVQNKNESFLRRNPPKVEKPTEQFDISPDTELVFGPKE